jgi:hypothetical protein
VADASDATDTSDATGEVVLRCRWCGRRFDRKPGPGRPKEFCRQGCRQQAHMARKLADAYGLGPGDVIVSRDALEQLQGALYCLQAAIEDVDRDLADARTKGDLQDALRWLLDNARPLSSVWIEPRTTSG